MKDSIRRFFGVIVFVLLTISGIKAQPAEELAAYRVAYPNDDAVVLSQRKEVTITLKNGIPEITEMCYSEHLLLNDNFKSYIEDHVTYSGMVELLEIKAYTLVPDGKHYRKEMVNEFRSINNPDASVFFDDEIQQSFVFPSLQPGAKTVVTYTVKYKEPRLFGANFFQDSDPVISSDFVIEAPEEMVIGNKSFGPDNYSVKPEVTSHRSNKVWTWHLEKLDKVRGESDVSSMRRFMIHTKVWIASYKDKDGREIKYLSDLQDLYNWYVKLTDSSDVHTIPEMKTLVDSLTLNLKSDEERLKAVYYWVQDHIKYVAFEEGYMGLIPHNPSDVFKKRYGDCKDKSLLLKTLLGLANVKANLTWIGTRVLPYRYTNLPCSGNADHMILTYYDSSGKPWFLDATNTFLTWKLPSIAIQEKEALVEKDHSNFKIDTVPIVPAEDNLTKDSVYLTIDRDLIKGKGKILTTGFVKIYLIERIMELDAEKMKRSFSAYISKGNDKCKLDTFKLLTPYNRDAAFSVSYEFTVPDYIRKNGDETYVNLHLEKPLLNGAVEVKTKKFDTEYRYRYLSDNYFVLEIPQGFKVDFVPPDVSGENEFLAYSFSYKQTGNQVILHQYVKTKTLVLPKSGYEVFNKIVKQLNQGYNQSLILKQKL